MKSPISTVAGPLADALDAITAARAAITAAQADAAATDQAFADVLSDAVAQHLDTCDGEVDDQLLTLISTLYWDHRELRAGDLAAALGCSQKQLRGLAGTRLVTTVCAECREPVEVAATSRSSAEHVICEACKARRAAWMADVDDSMGLEPQAALSVTELAELGDHLLRSLDRARCDNQMTWTRRWARRDGRDEPALIAWLEGRGGFCDCEVLLNVAW